ncbi:MAG TPA: protein kinase, partial [Polyangiaceae bacterium]
MLPSPAPVSTRHASSSGVQVSANAHFDTAAPRTNALHTMDRYRLSCLLGRGGMAEVFLAAWQVAPEVVRPVVIKRLYSHFSGDPNLIRMFIDEARLVCQLEHEHIVKTYEVGLIDGHLCLAMEYLEGQTLQQLLRRGWENGEVPIPAAVYIAQCVLSALSFAHQATDRRGNPNEIVHRDISPHNIFITNSGLVKVLDFGVAKAKSHGQHTSTGIVKGKFAYIAPEQAMGQCVDGRADIWSIGVVLWEMLAGRRLFRADGDAATLEATLRREIPFLCEVRPKVPAELAMCVARALQRDPNLRYTDAASMAEDLNQYAKRLHARPSAVLISQLMNEHFSEEILQQQQLVGDLILLHEAQGASEPSQPQGPPTEPLLAENRSALTGTDVEYWLLARRRHRILVGLLTCLTAVVLLVGGVTFGVLSNRQAKPPLPPKLPEASVPAVEVERTPPPVVIPVSSPAPSQVASEPPSVPKPSPALPATRSRGNAVRAEPVAVA